jgi:dTDP-4-amino-4,6-dideoxygalactose transaminase
LQDNTPILSATSKNNDIFDTIPPHGGRLPYKEYPKMKVPFVSLQAVNGPLKDAFLKEVEQLLQQGDFILGKATGKFEQQYAAYNGTTYALGISNGLDALKICLRALGIGPGHEVIVPAHTYIATVLAVLEVGATPVLVDVNEDTFNLDVATVEAAIGRNTRAIIPVHLYGQACDMPAIMQLADRDGLYVVEDNAQAQGALIGGKKTGSWGHINATSFTPPKTWVPWAMRGLSLPMMPPWLGKPTCTATWAQRRNITTR